MTHPRSESIDAVDLPSDAPAASGWLSAARRVVIKIGSALVVDQASGELNTPWIESLAADIAAARRKHNQEVILVSSGAIALGRRLAGLPQGTLPLDAKQAAAAIGQIDLMNGFAGILAEEGLRAAQILLTPGDTEDRRRHLNARATLLALLELGAVPIINENDTVATAEIRFGDNDRLAARVAQMCSADLLVLLSDVDGLYNKDPRLDPAARHIPQVPAITPAIEAMAGPPGSADSSGGMVTKLMAAKIATSAGCHVVLSDGRAKNPLGRLMPKAGGAAERHTLFEAAGAPLAARKRWIVGHVSAAGALMVDSGAVRALFKGKSLLPAGVIRVDGPFERGDAIRILAENGREIGRGLSVYDSNEAAIIAGCRSGDIIDKLGYSRRDVMVHRDDLVLTVGVPPEADEREAG